MAVAFSFNQESGSLTMVLNNQPTVINDSHRYFRKIKEMLVNNADEAEILKFVSKTTIRKEDMVAVSDGRVSLVEGKVCLDGKELHNAMATRVYDFIRQELPFNHLLKFIENVLQNPSFRAQEELFTFLEHQNLPITDDGCFLAYKAIDKDWKDLYSHTIDNSIGNVIAMDRGRVDDDCTRGCSKGLHCGTLEYATSYGGSRGRMIIVKVHPADVVSVPKDCSCQKVRTCEYLCHAEYVAPLSAPIYDDDMKPCGVESDAYAGYDSDWYDTDDLDDDDAFDDGDVQVTTLARNDPKRFE